MPCRWIAALAFSLLPAAAAAQTDDTPPAAEPPVFSGPAEVVDGDTLKIDGQRIRLFGIDAPEMSEWPWGPRARSALEDLTDGRTVTCLQRDTDRYDRPVATCATAETPDLAETLIADGHAIAYRRFTAGTELHAPYLAAERKARDAGVGPAPVAIPEQALLDFVDRFQSGIGALVGAFAGLVAIVLGVLFNAKKTRERDDRIREEEVESLAAALAAECDTAALILKTIADRVKAEHMAAHERPSMPQFNVLSANQGRLGNLGPELARAVTRTAETIRILNELSHGDSPSDWARRARVQAQLARGMAVRLLERAHVSANDDHGDRQPGNHSSSS